MSSLILFSQSARPGRYATASAGKSMSLASAVNSGMRSLKMDGMEKGMMGLTDLRTVRSVCIK